MALGFGAANTGGHLEGIEVQMDGVIHDIVIDDQPVFRAFEDNTDFNAIGIEGLAHPRPALVGA
ncbi:hypothetical protein VB716_03510 [Synechococcus sp. CCY9201]|nr:hypothetical protein [Synechococcus sp. CCY9201]